LSVCRRHGRTSRQGHEHADGDRAGKCHDEPGGIGFRMLGPRSSPRKTK
jgi:hypothetical protein